MNVGIAMAELTKAEADVLAMERAADEFIQRRDCTDLRDAFIEGWQDAMEQRDIVDDVQAKEQQ